LNYFSFGVKEFIVSSGRILLVISKVNTEITVHINIFCNECFVVVYFIKNKIVT